MPAQVLTLEQRRALHDGFRTSFKGGRVEMLPAVMRLPPRIRARVLIRITLEDNFHPESDHSNGAFIFAGWRFIWEIYDESDGLLLLIGMYEQ
jgi:hypothetical protein